MELRTLQYFLAVAQEENISRAAQTLHLTQPTLSRQMMELERELGRQLFVRGKRRLTLTQEGLLLRKRAHELLELAEKTRTELRESGETVTGDVYIGAGETDAFRLLARSVATLRQQCPGLRCHISSGDSADVIERLDKGLLDFGVLVGLAPERYHSLELPIRDTWGVLMPRKHPLAQRTAIAPEDLWEQSLILSRQMQDGHPFFRWLGRSRGQLNIAATHNLIFNGSLMVQEGLGVAVTLDKIINVSGDSPLCFRPLEPRLDIALYVVWKQYAVFSTAAERFLRQLRQDLSP